MAYNLAIDYHRRLQRGAAAYRNIALEQDSQTQVDAESTSHARLLIQRFRQLLPKKWLPVFEARFVNNLSQSQAAEELHASIAQL
ncbi:MAG: hypothetical protein R3C68_12705 [Myxococcota bacterium]